MAWDTEGKVVALGGPKDRAALAVLALSANRVCSEAELIDSIWGDDPPDRVTNLLQNQVFRLRRALQVPGGRGPAIVTRPGGYELAVDSDDFDLLDVDGLLTEAWAAGKRGRHTEASDLCRRALACWRGMPLADLGDLPFVTGAQSRLEELRLGALESAFEADLACGRHRELVVELEAATALAPLREHLWELRMTALYRAGRQADALRAYQDVRRHLGEHLGLEPSPSLRALEGSIAVRDPDLDWRPAELPSGIVTFLQTDIEGSTELFHRLGNDYPAVLDAHDSLVRELAGRGGGIEVGHEADGFLFAFAEAPDAVAAAVAVQIRMNEQVWPPLRIRVGVHSGAAMPSGSGYVALPVHQVFRLTMAANGGQLLVSEAVASLVADHLPEGASLLDLGPHQLRDFPTAERVFQLAHPDLASDFPPLRSAAVIRHNLPRPRSRFVGRTEDVAELGRLLERTGVVSVVGPGGVGKTRVAIEAARRLLPRFPDGAWMVELAPLADGQLVADAIAAALGITEIPGRPILDAVIEHLRQRRALLVLDNCEHLVDAAAAVVDVMANSCSHLALLATSRVALRVDGEAVWRLPPLRAPEPGSAVDFVALASLEAVELFCDRASLASPRFSLDAATAPAVAAVTARLDGIPLALELAAARLADLDLTDVEAGLSDRFSLLSSGLRTAPNRQQTLWAAMDWSFGLLDDDTRRFFVSLAVFAGFFDTSAAAVVTEEPVQSVTPKLERLAELSLLEVVDDRYRMLETIRAYATTRLDELADSVGPRARHLVAFMARGEAARPHLAGPDPEWLEKIERDMDNLREALGWAMATTPLDALRLAVNIFRVWHFRGRYSEGVAWLEQALDRAGDQVDDLLRGRALLAWGALTASSDRIRCLECLQQAVAIFRSAPDVSLLARALCDLQLHVWAMGQLDEADAILAEGLATARAADDPVVTAILLSRQSEAALLNGQSPEATQQMEECISVYRQAGAWQELMWQTGELGWEFIRSCQPEKATPLLDEALGLALQLQYPQGELWVRAVRGTQRYLLGDTATARTELTSAAMLCRQIGDHNNGPWVLSTLARVALAEGEIAEAHTLFTESIHMALHWGHRLHGVCRRLAVLAAAYGDAAACAQLIGCRAKLGDEGPMTLWDVHDLAWAESAAREQLGDDAFDQASAAGYGADPSRLLLETCARLNEPAPGLRPLPSWPETPAQRRKAMV
jgi:predicted ATPase/class 3 adenylate cyclase